MIQLTDKLYVIEVPLDAHSFDYVNGTIFYYIPNNGFIQSIYTGHNSFIDYTILGTCTDDDIDFDVEPYIKDVYDPNTFKKSLG